MVDRLCTGPGVGHRLTPPDPPQTNGKVERFNSRIEDVPQSHHFRSGEETETTLREQRAKMLSPFVVQVLAEVVIGDVPVGSG